VFATSPTFVTPALGTPSSGNLANCTFPTLNQNTTGSAATLTTGRTIAITGDLTYTSPTFNGSTNVTAAGTLATVNANVGSFTNASVTVNGKGLVTAVSSGTAPVTAVSGTSPVVSSGGATPAISLSAGYGDTLNPYGSKTANTFLAAPNASAGVPTFRAIVAADIPTLNQNTTGSAATLTTARTIGGVSFNGSANINLPGVNTAGNQNTTGTAANVTGTVAIANGGTGATTQQAAINALAGAVTSAQYLRGNGTNILMSAIQAADVPTLNQNTTGSAATLTTARTIGGVSFNGSANINLPGVNTAGNQNTTGTAANVTGTVAIANGGTGGTTAQAARNNIAAAVTNGQYLRGNGTNVLMSAIQAADVPTLNQNTTGSAATLTTARTINGVSFNGSANITITAAATNVNTQLASLGVGTAASGTAGEIRATNNITAYFSDDRLKTRLGGIENALEKVRSLEGFFYEPNDVAQALGYDKTREVGVSAQQVQKVLPEIVVPAPIDDKYWTVRYEKLVPLLIEAIKELDGELQSIKQQLKD
jgi:hypothetical protein